MKIVYLDNMAGQPPHPQVIEAMTKHLNTVYGNPSSQHQMGDLAKGALVKARENVAALVGAAVPKEIVFESCGTESCNHAIKGVALAKKEKGRHIITTNVEHNAVIRPLRALKAMGWRITSLDVDATGRVDPAAVAGAIEDDTVLISVQHSNNEIGTLQPVAEIGAIAKERKVTFHCDAVDSVGVVPVNVDELGVDLLSMAASQFGGATGAGALYIRRGTALWPLLDGGTQENHKRAGTENLAAIVGMGKAAELAMEQMDERAAKYRELKERLIKGITGSIDEVTINGSPRHSLPHLVSASISYIEGESVMLMLDEEGICVATRSACASGSLRASHVLLSCGLDHAQAQGTMVITLGPQNTFDEIDYFLEKLGPIVQRLREMSPLYRAGK